jgi:hypothetical protein
MLGLALLGAAAVAEPSIPYDLAAAVAGYDRAQLNGDRAELQRLLADDYLLVNSSGKTETKAQLIADYVQPGFDLQTLVIEQPVHRVWDGGAVMGGIGTLSGMDSGKRFEARLRFADVWAKRNGEWQVVYTHAEKAAPASASETPTIRLVDPKSVAGVIAFAAADPKLQLKTAKAGEVWWRADVDLPRGASVKAIDMAGYAPVTLRLADGRCFEVGFEGRQPKMDQASIAEVDCATNPPRAVEPSAPPRSGLRFIGKTWNLGAWADPATGKSIVVRSDQPAAQPVLTTSMRVIAVGGLGSPDAPMTELTLAGYVGRQLTLVTVMLYLP